MINPFSLFFSVISRDNAMREATDDIDNDLDIPPFLRDRDF